MKSSNNWKLLNLEKKKIYPGLGDNGVKKH